MTNDLERTTMKRMLEILELINKQPDPNNAKILKFLVGYMAGSYNQITNQTDGYIAFMEGLESGLIEYKGE
jgi:hypothetical protein